jgi:ABC-type arginine transport system ATPase subunit
MDEGKIVEQGGPEMLQAPKTEKLKRFLDKVLTFHED